ncbi:DivIVA domain-containing protein [Micromonospora sp. NPDC000207]|uniref:DivIVA domain-containing protein n=1 Tax=Micromonospora sp. NPDC000207 TaxID=3154246 RepID=UPI00332A5D30
MEGHRRSGRHRPATHGPERQPATHGPERQPATHGPEHRPATHGPERRPLRREQVQQRQFTLVRRGLDPIEVARFLDRVARDLDRLHAEPGSVREENVRIKRALRDWQRQFTPGGWS